MSLSKSIALFLKNVAGRSAIFAMGITGGLVILAGSCQSTQSAEVSVMRVAHRGGAALAPENTLIAFQTGLEHDADALEMDVHLSQDGILVVAHDSALVRTTGQPGNIEDYTASYLANLDASVSFKGSKTSERQYIPTLEEVLDLVQVKSSRQVKLQIEIKLKADGSRYDSLEEKLVETLRRRGIVDRCIIISFDFPSLERIGKLEPALQRGALIGKKYMTEAGAKGPEYVAEEIKSLGVEYVGISYQYLSQTLFEEFRAHGIGVGVWTVNEPAMMKRFISMGVDFITSDNPELLMQITTRGSILSSKNP